MCIRDRDSTKREGLDSTVWPEAFERMEQFIQDTGLSQDDLDMNYDDIVEMYQSGKLAMYFGSSSGVKMFQDQGINTTFLPFFQENGEKWLMTTPYFQVALNRDLTKDETRRKLSLIHICRRSFTGKNWNLCINRFHCHVGWDSAA